MYVFMYVCVYVPLWNCRISPSNCMEENLASNDVNSSNWF